MGFVDPTDRPEVIEASLAALSGCIDAAVSTSAMFGDLAVEIEVPGEGLDDADLSYFRESVGPSAVYNLVTLAYTCEPLVRLTDGP